MFETILNLTSHWFWFSIGVLFLIAEMAIPGSFYMLIISVSSFLTIFSCLLTQNIWLILSLFILYSLLGIIFVKPILKKVFHIDQTVRPSTIDAIIGKTGVVITPVATSKKGTVKIGYETWTASTDDDTELEEGTPVFVKRIEGVTLIVGGVAND